MKSSVALLTPSSAERRVTTNGPKGSGPSCTGPNRTNSQRIPCCSAPSSSSWGGLFKEAGASDPVGRVVARAPTKSESTSNSGRVRRQRRQGRPLNAVNSSSKPTRARRHQGPARIGVSKKATVQLSFKRASRSRSQLLVPSTY